MLRVIVFISGTAMALGAWSVFRRIEDPFSYDGPELAFIALFWFILGTSVAVWAARRVLAGLAKVVTTWAEGENGDDILTLWIRCKKAELRAKTNELLSKAGGKAP